MTTAGSISFALRSSSKLAHPVRDEGRDWLGVSEISELHQLRSASRRREWLDSRCLAKSLLSGRDDACAGEARRWQVLSRDAEGKGRRPVVLFDGLATGRQLSISHSGEWSFVACCDAPSHRIGVDLVSRDETFSDSFLRVWFTAGERRRAGDSQECAAKVWAVKEAVYKAVQQGESFVPAKIDVVVNDEARFSAVYHGELLQDKCEITVWEAADCICCLCMCRSENWLG